MQPYIYIPFTHPIEQPPPQPSPGFRPDQVLTGEEEKGGGEQRNQRGPSPAHLEAGEPVINWARAEQDRSKE